MYNKKYNVIEKQETEDTNSEQENKQKNVKGEEYKDVLQKKSNQYTKPESGSKQDNYTKREIKDKLNGYKPLKTEQDKKILLKLKPFKVWIKYFNVITKKFRVGGLLKMVDPDLRYIMLVNLNTNTTWSVQLSDCVIFISEEEEEKQIIKQKEDAKINKEIKIKDGLYKLYKKGKLIKK